MADDTSETTEQKTKKNTDPKPDADSKPVTKPAEPKDDLVVTEHELKVGRKVLRYTATTGRVVLRDEVYEDGTFTGF